MVLTSLDSLWLIVCSALVFIMQGGFLCLESGCTRTKNSINVAVKNLTDFGISVIAFWLFGFGIMFGLSRFGLFGESRFLFEADAANASEVAFFLFQAMFCGTAVTIVSGAVAERMSFKGYLLVSLFVSALIYPLFGHWAWGGLLGGDPGWLAELGFIDFAGSTVVHGVGGWVALASVLVIGPRLGRFDEQGKPRRIHGQSLPLAMLGALLLCFGWIGFNGGSALSWGEGIPGIVTNTILAACSGLLVALFLGYAWRRYPDVKYAMNGLLAGLVAITANCHMVSSLSAVLIGGIGAVVMVFSDRLLERLGLDDAVGAFPVHAAAGIWGTLAVALFGDAEQFANGMGRLEQLVTQALGSLVCAGLAFGATYLFLRLVTAWVKLRVDPDHEREGLNASEHHVSTEHLDLLREMELQSRRFDLARRVTVEPFTEIGQIASKYNEVLDSLEKTVARNELIVRDAKDGILTCSVEGTILRANPSACAMFGFETLEGRSVWQLLQRSDGGLLESFEQLIRVSASYVSEQQQRPLVGLSQSGELSPVEVETTEGKIGGQRIFTVKVRDRSRSEKYKTMLQKAKEEAERTRDELEEKVRQIEAFNGLAVDRELRMAELKRQIDDLSQELGREPPFGKELQSR
ncbi:ammonium transporter [Pelagicoccus sp. SDUM812003]|uniref:ammonium transporter n=1 Tax=Pelagicoccus sp. SDUM812003 TaxID=3041267 RepID=UPI00280F3F4A|nr:ammonium transporter [Pelagicoccus sp. SDUM812003]MDQ8203573.1 ammonium transporter [Pelagicoccus sp. SDUM812003]